MTLFIYTKRSSLVERPKTEQFRSKFGQKVESEIGTRKSLAFGARQNPNVQFLDIYCA